MGRARSYAPVRSKPPRAGGRRRPGDESGPAPDPTGLVSLQRLAGNRAVQAVATQKPGSRANAPTVQRLLWTKEEFRKQTDAGFLSGRGKTIRQIDKLLDEYHGIRKDGMHLRPGGTQDRAINILHEIIEDIGIWQESHEGDTSRSAKRIPGLTRLALDAAAELRELEGIRKKSREFLQMDQKPVERTENKFKTQMEGSFSSVLSRLGPIFSASAPSEGDTAEVEVAIKVPVDPSGTGYLGFRVKAQVERVKKQATKLRFELAVVGGAKVGNVAEIGGELGMYLESQGATPEKALELISYGVYRRFRESKVIPNEVANFIWGGSGTSVGWKRAEKWAAKVEKENFKGNTSLTGGATDADEQGAYVETGGLLGAKAKGGVGGVAELEGTAQYSTGTHYDHDSVKNLKSAGLGKESPLPTRRGQTEVIGESVHHLEFGFSAKGGPFSGGLKVGIDWSTQNRNEGLAKLQSVKVGLEASAQLPMTELVAGGIGGYIPPIAATVIKGIRAAATGAANDKRTAGQNAGEVMSACENGATAMTQISGLPKTAWQPSFALTDKPPTFAAPVELKLSLTGMYDFREGKFVFEVKVEYIKGLEVNAGVLELKVKKGQRIIRVTYDGGWKVD